MEKVYLSDAGPKVSPAIYGFYRWGKEENAPVSMDKIVHLCLDLGINTFDHADIYGDYQCEELFGKLIAAKSIKREDIILFTKCGLRIPHASQAGVRVTHIDTSKEHILKSIDNSLRKLNTDYIDIFLLNGFDPIADLEETALTLRQLKEKGKIKNIGIVNFTVFQHQLLASYLHLFHQQFFRQLMATRPVAAYSAVCYNLSDHYPMPKYLISLAQYGWLQ